MANGSSVLWFEFSEQKNDTMGGNIRSETCLHTKQYAPVPESGQRNVFLFVLIRNASIY